MVNELKIAVFYNLPIGGEIKALHDNLKFLKDNGHKIDVYTLDIFTNETNETYAPLRNFVDNYYIHHVKRSKPRKIFFNSLNKLIPSINIPHTSKAYFNFNEFKNVQKKIAAEINNKEYDVVISGKDGLFTTTPAIFQYLKKPIIYYCQDPSRRDEKILENISNTSRTIYDKLYSKFITKKYAQLDAEYAKYADQILVNSYYSHENLLKVYGLNSRVSYLGINNNQFHRLNLPRENFILTVGAIVPIKGFDFIINSIALINKEIRPKLVITGYSSWPNWKNHLTQLAENKDVELEILENIPYEKLVELYNKAKIFAFASYLEPFGLVSLESMACGTPVVVVKEGGIREIVQHDKNGFLIDRDEILFSKAIEELFIDEKKWETFSNEGPKYVKNYWTLEHSGQRLLNHIYRVLDEKKRY